MLIDWFNTAAEKESLAALTDSFENARAGKRRESLFNELADTTRHYYQTIFQKIFYYHAQRILHRYGTVRTLPADATELARLLDREDQTPLSDLAKEAPEQLIRETLTQRIDYSRSQPGKVQSKKLQSIVKTITIDPNASFDLLLALLPADEAARLRRERDHGNGTNKKISPQVLSPLQANHVVEKSL
ncbi:MAG: hypothetical protein NC924_00445 [Candidatus Omnitrophica bacterium]|nr:hypothetical protein [Candidatus Omnitrophota bacterium]